MKSLMAAKTSEASGGLGGLRSLICDTNGIVIAEAVYRCMICADVFENLEMIHVHYKLEHLEGELSVMPPPRGSFSNYSPQSSSSVAVDYEDDNFEMPDSATSYDHFDRVNGNWKSARSDHLQSVTQPKKKKKPANVNKNKAALVGASPSIEVKIEGEPVVDKNPPGINHNNNKTVNKGGYVTCQVCGKNLGIFFCILFLNFCLPFSDLTRFYSHISRRYGVFSCESCAKFFYRYSQKPVKYVCTGDGACPLNIDIPGSRCKACLLDACFKKYVLDPKKHPKIFENEAAIFSPLSVDGVDELNNNDVVPNFVPTLETVFKVPQKKVPSTAKNNNKVPASSDDSNNTLKSLLTAKKTSTKKLITTIKQEPSSSEITLENGGPSFEVQNGKKVAESENTSKKRKKSSNPTNELTSKSPAKKQARRA